MKKLTFVAGCLLAIQASASFAASIDLSSYSLVGRYDLPDPSKVAAPANNLLAQEASGITYNWDTDTLFIIGDGSTSITQVSKTGQLIDVMTLAQQAGNPQGTAFYDAEGITYIGNGQFVFTEERLRVANLVTYAAGTTIGYNDAQHVKLGTTVGNVGLEGLTYDPKTGGYIFAKEINPQGLFQTTLDFTNGTASNGSAATVNSVNLFDPALLGVGDIADVFALSNLTNLIGALSDNLIVVSQESARLVETDRSGNVLSTFNLSTLLTGSDSLSAQDMQFEGITMDRQGYIYLTTENGGGDISKPQMFVLAPRSPLGAVPEPATWAMMIGGLALTGATLRRRQARVRFA